MKKIFTLIFLSGFLISNAQVDGTLDPNFGNNGDGTSANAAGLVINNHQKLIVLPNKKILQVFSVNNGVNHSDFGIALFDSTGVLDPSFGTGGIVNTDFGGDDFATSVAVQPNGIITVAGYSINNVTTLGSFALARYDSLGNLDINFNAGGPKPGTRLIQIGQDDRAYSIALVPVSQKIIVAGFSVVGAAGSPTEIAVAKFDTVGNFDLTFNAAGTPGKILSPTNGKNNEAYAMAIQADGKIVVAGNRINTSGTTKEFLVLRYTTTGVLDGTFGTGGVATTDISTSGTGTDNINSVAIQSNGMVVVAGSSTTAVTDTLNVFALARYSTSGVLDPTFKNSTSPIAGVVETTIGTNDYAYSIGQQLNGKLVVAGTSFSPVSSSYDFVVARYNIDGSLDNTFNEPSANTNPPAYEPAPGIVAIDFQFPSGINDFAYSFGAQGNNLIVGGMNGISLALARLTSSSTFFDPLPLELYSFTANRQDNEVLLRWKTTSETNTSYFEIQRSTNGTNFTTIGKVTASGNSTSEKNYSFVDAKPLTPIGYYRLRMVDKDLKQTFSNVLYVRFEAATVPLLVFPNPVRDQMNIQLNTVQGPLVIQVYDAGGKLVKALNVQSPGGSFTTTIDSGNLPQGMYFIKIKNDIVKVIKE